VHHPESPSVTSASDTGTGERVATPSLDDAQHSDYDGTCLRPLGLCELGGSCDACWYRPDHPRFRRPADG
jgi:hypothetical protein